MKTRAIILAVTLTALFFIPMTAIPTESFQNKAENNSLSQNEQIGEESAAQSGLEPEKANSFTEESFRIYDLTSKEIYEIGAADYVRGAIAAEMGSDFEFEALVAQGRAAISCALYQKSAHTDADYDFTADPQNRFMFVTEEQVREIYGEAFGEKWNKICLAAEEALSAVVTFDGAPAMTVYHAISAGKTQSAADIWGGTVPYLTEVESAWDENCEGFITKSVRSKEEVLESLNAYGAKLSGAMPEQWFQGGEYTSGGYLKRIQIGSATFSGSKLRTLFGLRSSAFTAEYSDGEFVFTVRGYGHGVGMSQVGANEMAKNGALAEEILEYYYPGTKLLPASNY